jgi:hypothetical protein
MRRNGIVWVLAVLLAGSLACDSIPFLQTTLTATASPTAGATASPTVTPMPTTTRTPYPTRTPLPTLIPGVEEPVAVGDADLLILNVLRRDAFRCRSDSEPVENPEEQEFLLLLLKVVKGPALSRSQVENWIEKNGIDRIGVAASGADVIDSYGRCFIQNPDNMILTEIHLAFVVARNSEGFVLLLPDGMEISLESFLP